MRRCGVDGLLGVSDDLWDHRRPASNLAAVPVQRDGGGGERSIDRGARGIGPTGADELSPALTA